MWYQPCWDGRAQGLGILEGSYPCWPFSLADNKPPQKRRFWFLIWKSGKKQKTKKQNLLLLCSLMSLGKHTEEKWSFVQGLSYFAPSQHVRSVSFNHPRLQFITCICGFFFLIIHRPQSNLFKIVFLLCALNVKYKVLDRETDRQTEQWKTRMFSSSRR